MWPWLDACGKWVVKFIGGFLPIGTKPLPEWLGKVLWFGGMFFICYFAITHIPGCKKANGNQQIVAQKGSQVTIVQNNQQKKRLFIPFIEGFAEKKSQEGFDTGIRTGLRFEF